jgi:hypothetical protein
MFSFIDAGGRFAHFTRPWELCPPEPSAQALPVGGGAPKKDVGVAWEGQPCDDRQDEAQLGVQTTSRRLYGG